MRTRTFLAIGVLVALLIAGVASFYASSHPDGLNYVAEKTGFIDQEKASATSDGPFAGYATKGVDNERLSGGIAGVAGCLLVLTIAGSLTWAVRRRGHEEQSDTTDETSERESV
ncbi:PDGLE domain-containing protein [Nocardioides sp.]|uniref:PDGLE domain-containing protein n=1 Tax=Nocardioides sp. TaxID=35761 RepID=UPI003D0F0E98